MYFKYFLLLIIFLFYSCADLKSNNKDSGIEIIEIELQSEFTIPELEISGMDWYNDILILLPQYPNQIDSENDGSLLSIEKEVIKKYFNKNIPLSFQKIELLSNKLETSIKGYQGYEAIVFIHDTVYLTIEANYAGTMKTYIISGKFDPINNRLRIDYDSLTEIPLPENINNMGFETLIINNNRIIAIFEANGPKINNQPYAVSFDLNLKSYQLMHFPNIDFRITDATKINSQSEFWCINYMYPGETNLLKPVNEQQNIERLVQCNVEKNSIVLLNTKSIEFKRSLKSRNWEGLVQFDSLGFLIVTDRFPETVFAYVPYSFYPVNLEVFEENQKFGYKNELGFEVIKPNYIFALPFNEQGIAAVVDDSGWVYVNNTAKKMIRPHIIDNGPDYFSYGLSRYVKNAKYGFFNQQGSIEIKSKFDFARSFKDSVAAVCQGCKLAKDSEHVEVKNGKWGFIDLKGKLIVPCVYDSVSDFEEGQAIVSKNGQTQIIQRDSNIK